MDGWEKYKKEKFLLPHTCGLFGNFSAASDKQFRKTLRHIKSHTAYSGKTVTATTTVPAVSQSNWPEMKDKPKPKTKNRSQTTAAINFGPLAPTSPSVGEKKENRKPMKRAGWGVLSLWSILYHLNNYELTNREPTEKKK